MGAGDSVAARELTLQREDGSRLCADVSLVPIAAEDGAAVSGARGMLRDATPRKQIQAALQALQGSA